MLDYLEDFPLFGWNYGFPEENILKPAEFLLLHQWQKQMPVQGFDLYGNSLTELVEFYKHI